MSVKNTLHTFILTIVTFVVINHITTSSSTVTSSHIHYMFAPSVMAYQTTVTRPMRTCWMLSKASSSSSTTGSKVFRRRSSGTGQPCAWARNTYHRYMLPIDDRISPSVRLFRSNPNRGGYDDYDDNDNKFTGKLQQWFSKAAKKVKSILPSWAFSGGNAKREGGTSQSEFFDNQSIRKSARRQRQDPQPQQDISSSLDSLFRDSPLGIRLMGNMIVKPLFSSLAGSLAQTMQEQQREMNDLLEEARTLILYDKNLVASLGGEPIQVSPPFSQSSSSSTVSVSGGRTEKRSRVEASFQVTGGRGSYGSGVATMVAVNGVMERLYVNVQGRYYEVKVGTRGGASSTVVVVDSYDDDDDNVSSSSRKTQGTTTWNEGGIGKNHKQGGGGKDDIIDAEFVDKKVYKR